jgi:hypothetical protein
LVGNLEGGEEFEYLSLVLARHIKANLIDYDGMVWTGLI